MWVYDELKKNIGRLHNDTAKRAKLMFFFEGLLN
jgi:hypothetical protein